jgi:hypothetical protein
MKNPWAIMPCYVAIAQTAALNVGSSETHTTVLEVNVSNLTKDHKFFIAAKEKCCEA